MRGKKIVLLTLQHFSNAPRAQKESAALAKAGAKVTVLGSWWDAVRADEDLALAASLNVHYIPLLDLRPNASGSTIPRIIGKIARILFRRFGIVLPEAFGLTARRMLKKVRQLNPDLVMVHCEPGLWAGCRLLDEGFRVGVDFEDWFSEDLLPEARLNRPVKAIAKAEKILLNRGSVKFATTEAMAKALREWSGIERAPLAIPNCFAWSGRAGALGRTRDSRSEEVSFYWCSQTVGPGRGLEDLGKALLKVSGNWKLCLRGILRAPPGWFETVFLESIRDRVEVLSPVTNVELLGRHMSHDIGLAVEIPFCGNKNVTASNKIFDYLRAGLAVIATDTQGQREVMEGCPTAGWLVPASDVGAMTKALQEAVNDSEGLVRRKQAALAAAEDRWAWESYESALVNAVSSALGQ